MYLRALCCTVKTARVVVVEAKSRLSYLDSYCGSGEGGEGWQYGCIYRGEKVDQNGILLVLIG
jgi:hypothetical protein